MDIGVLGAGAWGSALALALSRDAGRRVRLWAREEGLAATMRTRRENARYLPGVALPPVLLPVDSFAEAIAADIVIAAPAVAGL